MFILIPAAASPEMIGMSFMTTESALASLKTAGFGVGLILLALAALVVLYLYKAMCLLKIGIKTGCPEPSWMAWVPVLNLYYFVRISDYPGWYFWLLFVPLINIIIWIMMWYFWLLLVPLISIIIGIMIMLDILKKLGRHWFWLILLFVPVVNFVIMGILAFTGESRG